MSADASKAKTKDTPKGGDAKGDKKAKGGASAAAAAPPEVFSIADLKEQGKEISIAKDTQGLGWKINTSLMTVDPDALKKLLTTPAVKKIDLQFLTGMKVTARNMKGVTIKDALDAIHKIYKKKKDDEVDEPYLAGFEWDPEESWDSLKVHLNKEASGGKKKKDK
jgi:hypothetical protein